MDLTTGAEWDIEDSSDSTTISLSPDGSEALLSDGFSLYLWDVNRRILLHAFRGHTLNVTSVAITPDWRFALSVGSDSKLVLWNIERRERVHTFPLERGSRGGRVTIAPDGRRAITSSEEVPLKIWDLERGVEIYSSATKSGSFFNAAITPDSQRALIGSYRTVSILDLVSGAELGVLGEHSSYITAVAVAPNGQYAVSGSEDHTLKVWDLTSAGATSVRKLSPLSASDTQMSISHSANRVMILRGSSQAEIWHLDKATTEQIPVPIEVTHPAVLTSDGQQIVSVSDEKVLEVMNIESGMIEHALSGHGERITALMATREPGRVVSASTDGTFRIWDTRHGLELNAIHNVAGPTTWIRQLSDCRYALSLSKERVSLWDLERGKLLESLQVEPSPAFAVALSDLHNGIVCTFEESEIPVTFHEGCPNLHPRHCYSQARLARRHDVAVS